MKSRRGQLRIVVVAMTAGLVAVAAACVPPPPPTDAWTAAEGSCWQQRSGAGFSPSYDLKYVGPKDAVGNVIFFPLSEDGSCSGEPSEYPGLTLVQANSEAAAASKGAGLTNWFNFPAQVPSDQLYVGGLTDGWFCSLDLNV